MNPRVFIFENVKHDLSAAEKFGQVVVLFREGAQRRSIFDALLIEDIKNRLSDYNFDSSRDYIAVTGQLNQVTLLVVAIAEENKEVSLLLFDARDRIYQEIIVNPNVNIQGGNHERVNKTIIPLTRQDARRSDDGLTHS